MRVLVLLLACTEYNVSEKDDNNPAPVDSEPNVVDSVDSEPPPPPDEECNGEDDDLDGLVDEDPTQDDDGDGLGDEDPVDTFDNDLDGLVDEDPAVDDDNDGLMNEDPGRAPVDTTWDVPIARDMARVAQRLLEVLAIASEAIPIDVAMEVARQLRESQPLQFVPLCRDQLPGA